MIPKDQMLANLRPVAGAGVTAGGFGFTTGAAVDKIFISVVVGCGHQVCLVVGCGHQVFWPDVCLVVGCGHQVCLVVGCGHQVFLAVDGPAVGAMDAIVCFMVHVCSKAVLFHPFSLKSRLIVPSASYLNVF